MKKYKRSLIILILSLLTVFALMRFGDVEISTETLSQVRWFWLGLAIATFYSGQIMRGLRWRRILKTMGWRVNHVYAQTLMMTGLVVSIILPARAGDIGRVALLKQDYKIPVSQGIASIAVERALDVFSILVLAITGALWALQGRLPQAVLELMIGATVLFVIGLVGLLAIPSFEDWLRRPGRLEALTPTPIWSLYQKALDFGFSLIHGVRSLGRSPLTLAVALIESFYIWLVDALLIHFVLYSLDMPVQLGVSLFAGMIGALAAAVPVTPGALGQYDAVVIGLLSLFGLTSSVSSLAMLLLRFVNFWTFIPVGGLVAYAFGFSRVFDLGAGQTTLDQVSSPGLPVTDLIES
jgi:uncharacterized protein (TIRG00374 family)